MKQNSIEWLFEQYKLVGMLTTAQVEKAKEMHKEEIENAYCEGGNWDEVPQPRFENYYNETFNTK